MDLRRLVVRVILLSIMAGMPSHSVMGVTVAFSGSVAARAEVDRIGNAAPDAHDAHPNDHRHAARCVLSGCTQPPAMISEEVAVQALRPAGSFQPVVPLYSSQTPQPDPRPPRPSGCL